ncbi:peptide ABC transporter substrate-binding protein [Kytococcus schroeteri]|uniref:Peptide ABC transporter substrate-binding protein n=1 Tax=Kytococcus schroeteri TaxID=138300 RepID=A0A2I1PCY1_9MICO|nr:peptide ABC transporter substrate-binding protein [Kytococcus schroeteri]
MPPRDLGVTVNRSTRRAAALAGAALLVLTACSAGSSTDPDGSGTSGSEGASGPSDETVTLGLVAEPATLDFRTGDGAAIPQLLLGNVYETLVTVDPESGEIVDALAESHEVSDDRLTYTFTLPTDRTFSDGSELTAQDVVSSIEAVQGTAWTSSLKSQMDVVESAEATDDHTVEVTLSEPSNSWLYAMTTRVGAVFPSETDAELATNPVGSGPYDVTDWKRGDRITLERREDFTGEKPYFATAVFRYFKDGTALNNAMLTGDIDIETTVQAPESLSQFEGKDDLQVIEGTTNGEVVLSFNHGNATMQSEPLRQAIRHAIDHQALLDTCWAGKGELIGSMVPPTDPWYTDRTGDFPHDLEKAKDLVEEAGVDRPLRLRVPTLPYATECGQVVKSQLEEAGLRVQLDQLEFPASWLEQVYSSADYDLSIVAHVEPRDLGNVFGNPEYYLRYENPELTKALQAADAGTQEEQTEQMRKAAEIISTDAAADFLFLLPNLVVADADIQGIPTNAVTEGFDLTALRR